MPTTRKIVGTLHALLEYAVSENLVAVNAARRIRVKGRRDEGSKKIVPPSKDTLRRLIEVADEDLRVEIIFAAATGVRAGELHALRWRHVDLEKAAVTVETRVDAHNQEDAPKSKAGFRTVPVGADVVKRLREWKVRSKFSKASDLVFPNGKGRYKAHSCLLEDQFYPLFAKLAQQHESDPDNAPPCPDSLRMARSAAFRGLVLDRSRNGTKGRSNVRGAQHVGNDDERLRAPLPV